MEIVDDGIKVYRNELKYFIKKMDYLYLKSIFDVVLERDFYGKQSGEYWIRSLYFDTIQNSSYYEKILGLKDRKKIRLRLYDVNSNDIKIEIKNRYDQYMMKETATIFRTDAIELINGNTDVLLKYNNKVTNKVYAIMHTAYYRPSVIIDYEREAYTCPINNIRITFDKNIRVCKNSYNLFEKEISTLGIFEEETIVLEVKYDRMLPKFIRDILSTCSGLRSSISKYCLARDVLK